MWKTRCVKRLNVDVKMFFGMIGLMIFLTQAVDYYVAPNGSDGNAGTVAAPFATISKARDVVRTINTNMTSTINVYLRGGWYFQSSTLAFTQADGGTNNQNVIYQAYPGEYPVISGGKQVTGWTVHDATKNIWKANAPAGIGNRQLYVNCVRAVRAHKRTGLGFGTYTINSSGYSLSQSSGMQTWGNQSDIELVFRAGNSAWNEARCGVSSITSTAITMKQPGWQAITAGSGWQPLRANSNSDIENAYELLNEPGEWYFDKTAGIVYYIPRTGENLATAEVIAPVLEVLVSATGTLDAPVRNMQFKNITFAHATYLRPNTNGWYENQANDCYGAPGNINISPGNTLRFERCTFTHLGGVGLFFQAGSKNNAVVGCVFTDISANCIAFGDWSSDGLAAVPARFENNQVTNSYIHHSPVEYRGGVGILAGHCINFLISHNEICYTPYSGTSVGFWFWRKDSYIRENTTSYNKVHDNVQWLDDGGSIYTKDEQENSQMHHNYIYNWNRYGFYMDDQTSYFKVYSNVVADPAQPYHPQREWCRVNESNAACHDDTIINNFRSTSNNEAYGGEYQNNNVLVTNGQWPAEAVAIMNSAGVESAYSDVLTMPCACKVMRTGVTSTEKPAVVSARVVDAIHIEIVFNKGIELASAQTTGNYQINGVSLSSAQLSGDLRVVTLTTSANISENTQYTITINNIRDRQLTPNTIAANTTVTVFGLGYNMVGWWKFNETSGTTASDASGHGFNGTLSGNTTWTTGKLGGALSFGGSSGSVSIPAGALGSLTGGDCAASAWVYINDRSNWNTIFAGTKMKLSVWSCNFDYSILGYGFNATNCGNVIGYWIHLVLQKKGTFAQAYYNGKLVVSELVGSTAGQEVWTLGANAYSGLIDDVRLYNRSLSEAEILQLTGGYAGPASMAVAALSKPGVRSAQFPEYLSIYNLKGALVQQVSLADHHNVTDRTIMLTSGTYLVKMVYGSECIVRKMVVPYKGRLSLSQIATIKP